MGSRALLSRALLAVLTLVLIVVFALVSRRASAGLEMRDTASTYLARVRSGDCEAAWRLLTDSLGGLVLPGRLSILAEGTPSPPAFARIGAREERGRAISMLLENGQTRMVWLRRSPPDGYRVSGDTGLDGLLAGATIICRDYAEGVVAPAVRAGSTAAGYRCPFSGAPYGIDSLSGNLVCSAGHLGEGISLTGEACSIRRDSVVAELEAYLRAGFPAPGSLEEMWALSDGEFGRRGGYRCPDNGYSYFVLRDCEIYCPHHDKGTVSATLEQLLRAPAGPDVDR